MKIGMYVNVKSLDQIGIVSELSNDTVVVYFGTMDRHTAKSVFNISDITVITAPLSPEQVQFRQAKESGVPFHALTP